MTSFAGRRVLIFGDSLSSGSSSPGYALGARLAADHGATVKIDARVGRSAWNFYNREDADAHFADAHAFAPHVAIVQLGTNDLGLTLSLDRERMVQLRDALASTGAEVWAIGPPSFPAGEDQARAPAVVDMMQSVFGSRFVDLRPLTADMTTAGAGGRSADGVHFTAAGSKIVGERLAHQMSAPDTSAGWLLAALAIAGAWLWMR